MNIQELFHESITLEENTLAHYIHHLLQEKKISLEDEISKLDLFQANHQMVKEMIENNVLGFHKSCVYSLKLNKNYFVYIFAENQQEAIDFFSETFCNPPLNCHEYPLWYELNRGNEEISFMEIRKEHKSFPAIAGYFQRY